MKLYLEEHDVSCALEVNSNGGSKQGRQFFHGVNVSFYSVNVLQYMVLLFKNYYYFS